ncbi:hypothetical protein Btru_026529 [Bulinus truncatus]|nr:hypothetical protein Btru_026529 [Bulinus truncatus]
MTWDIPRPEGSNMSEEEWKRLVESLEKLDAVLPPTDHQRTLDEVVRDAITLLKELKEEREAIERRCAELEEALQTLEKRRLLTEVLKELLFRTVNQKPHLSVDREMEECIERLLVLKEELDEMINRVMSPRQDRRKG